MIVYEQLRTRSPSTLLPELAPRNTGVVAAIGDAVSPDYVRHDPNSPEVRGPEAEQQLVVMYLAAFPDLHFTAEHVVAEGDTVVVRLRIDATHEGELLGIPPTGSRITLTATEWYRLAEGKIVEQWVMLDALGLLQQLGAIPSLGQEA